MPFLTPDAPTAPVFVWMIVPDTLLKYVSGTLLELTKTYNWEKFGSLSIVDTLRWVETIYTDLSIENTPIPSDSGPFRMFVYVDTPDGFAFVTVATWNPVVVWIPANEV